MIPVIIIITSGIDDTLTSEIELKLMVAWPNSGVSCCESELTGSILFNREIKFIEPARANYQNELPTCSIFVDKHSSSLTLYTRTYCRKTNLFSCVAGLTHP